MGQQGENGKSAPDKRGPATESKPDNRQLPTVKRKPVASAANRTIVLYGVPKVGKTTWAAGMPEPLFFAFEDGARHLEVFIVPEKELEYTWEMWLDDLRRVRTLVKSGKCPYGTLVIDVAELCFEACRKYCLKKYGAVHESDLEWGKGWSIVEWEFSRVLAGVKNLGLGLVLLTHMDDKEVADFAGKKHTKHTTALPKKAREIVFGMADVILFAAMGIDPVSGKWRRELHTKPSQDYEAGGRYLNPEGMPRKLPLAWEPFRIAFEEGLTEHDLEQRYGFWTRERRNKADTSIGDEEQEGIDSPIPPSKPEVETKERDPFEERVADGETPGAPQDEVEPFEVEPFEEKVGESGAIQVEPADSKPEDPVLAYAKEVIELKGDNLREEWRAIAKRVGFAGDPPRKVAEARAQLVEWFKQQTKEPGDQPHPQAN